MSPAIWLDCLFAWPQLPLYLVSIASVPRRLSIDANQALVLQECSVSARLAEALVICFGAMVARVHGHSPLVCACDYGAMLAL